MLRIRCAGCGTEFTLDDAFAGGVCRCQQCGTIQTVPKPRSGGFTGAGGGRLGSSGSTEPQTLYKRKPHTPGSGLEELADIVASSGLVRSDLTMKRGTRATSAAGFKAITPNGSDKSTAAHRERRLRWFLFAFGILLALLLGVSIWLLVLRGTSGSAAASRAARSRAQASASGATAASPTFLDVPLDGATVVYLLDCGASNRDSFDYVKLACAKSVESLRPNQRFQVAFWQTTSVRTFPAAGTSAPSSEAIEGLRAFFDDVQCLGASDVMPALDEALAQGPAVIVLTTGKALEMPWANDVLGACAGRQVRFCCFAIDEPAAAAPLRAIAEKTRGVYREVSLAALRALAR